MSEDGSCIWIDTNPYLAREGYFDPQAGLLMDELYEELDVPDSVVARMGKTRALDGVQTYEGEWYTISWTYHPDEGLEILYEKNKLIRIQKAKTSFEGVFMLSYSFSNIVSFISGKSRSCETVISRPTAILCKVFSFTFLDFPVTKSWIVVCEIPESVDN